MVGAACLVPDILGEYTLAGQLNVHVIAIAGNNTAGVNDSFDGRSIFGRFEDIAYSLPGRLNQLFLRTSWRRGQGQQIELHRRMH